MLRLILLVVLAAFAAGQLISIPLRRMKSPRQTMAEVGTDVEDVLRFMKPKPKPKPHNDSVALFKYLDGEFYGEIGIGHPAQVFTVVFDTSWANTWVPSSQCNRFSPPCFLHRRYKSKASSTYIENGTSFRIDFSNKDVMKGFLSTDVVNVAHTTVHKVTFAEIVKMPLTFLFNKADGVLGLGLSPAAVDGVPPIFYTMVKDGLIKEPIFSIYMNRDFTSKRGGNLILGGVETKHYFGNFTYLPIVDPYSWKIKLDRMDIDLDKNKTKSFCTGGCNVILDTSTITIAVPQTNATAINKILEASSEYFGRSKVPCNLVAKLPHLTFVFGAQKFVLKPEVYIQKMTILGVTMCLTPFTPSESNDWIIGGAFISQYYTVFDLGKRRVGFALARG